MNDDVLTRNENGELAVRTVAGTEQANVVNPDDVYTRTVEGYLAVRTTGGSGGGDSHNLGYYDTLADLEEAHPTGEAGDWAIVAESDTVYIWDATQQAWVDTDRKGQVTSVNEKTGAVVLTAEDVGAVPQYSEMPLASQNVNKIIQYIGIDSANFKNGYFYKGIDSSTYTSTVSFSPASESGITVSCSGSDFAAFIAEWASSQTDITNITSAVMAYDASAALWMVVCSDGESEEPIAYFQLYQEDFEDAGFTFSGTPANGDMVTISCEITIASTSYNWNRIDVQPTPDPLPDQTGQSGKFLTTNGSSASWSDKPLVNTATGTNSLTILGNAATNSYSINIGLGSSLSAAGYQTVVGDSARTVGSSSNYATVLGAGATVRNAPQGIAIGAKADANASHAIQIGSVSAQISTTNSDANTVKIANANGNFEMMSADGTIPKGRLSKVITTPSTMPELTVAGWSNNTQTVTVSGVTATNTVFVSPAPASAADYAAAGIVCTAQAADSLTFTCTTIPSNAITVNVVIF